MAGAGDDRGDDFGLTRRGRVLKWEFCCRKASGERESILSLEGEQRHDDGDDGSIIGPRKWKTQDDESGRRGEF